MNSIILLMFAPKATRSPPITFVILAVGLVFPSGCHSVSAHANDLPREQVAVARLG